MAIARAGLRAQGIGMVLAGSSTLDTISPAEACKRPIDRSRDCWDCWDCDQSIRDTGPRRWLTYAAMIMATTMASTATSRARR